MPRTLTVTVVATVLDGSSATAVYERDLARLIQDEIDHLDGLLSTEPHAPGVAPLPAEEYRQAGHAWAYER